VLPIFKALRRTYLIASSFIYSLIFSSFLKINCNSWLYFVIESTDTCFDSLFRVSIAVATNASGNMLKPNYYE
jgi:hypothetical protein